MRSLRQRTAPVQYQEDPVSISDSDDSAPKARNKRLATKDERDGPLLKFAKEGINNAKEALKEPPAVKENTPPEDNGEKKMRRRNKKTNSEDEVSGRQYRLRERSSNLPTYKDTDDSEDESMKADKSKDDGSESSSVEEVPSCSDGESDGGDDSDDFQEAPKPAKRTKRSSRPMGISDDDDDEEDDDSEPAPKRQPSRRQPTRATRNKQVVDLEEEDDTNKPQKWQTRQTRNTRKASGAGKRKAASGSDKSESSEGSDSAEQMSSDVEVVEVKGSKPGKRSKASPDEDAGKKKKARQDSLDSCGTQVVGKLERGAVVEKILYVRYSEEGAAEYHVKVHDKSYRNTRWVSHSYLEKEKIELLRCFLKKCSTGPDGRPVADVSATSTLGVEPEWLRAERIVSERKALSKSSYLVKWCGLDYTDSTWEKEEDLTGEQDLIDQFKRWNAHPPASAFETHPAEDLSAVPEFLNGRKLRDYQVVSLNWMVRNWTAEQNCILGDEMGLGKTAQSIAVLHFMRTQSNIWGPFLVVAPLTTLGHWKREIETWSGMNVVVYAGGQAERDMIQEYEFYFNFPSSDKKKQYLAGKPKFNVLLTSYEIALKDKKVLNKFSWAAAVLDEAHRMKTVTSSAREAIQSLDIKWKLLLTGTPIQNNLKELFGIMNVVNPAKYPSMADFLEEFDGNPAPSLEQVKALQDALRPVLLRRMKEDVEDLPEKEEVIVKVCLTTEQSRYYKALYSQQIGALLAGASHKNLPQMRNLAMELRKLCCHPFLCNGLEDDLKARHSKDPISEVDLLVQASGKMVFLDKLLPKLKAEGRKVLIFSQFKIMLDVLEDYLSLAGWPVERIDGSVKTRERQDAIDRFMTNEQEAFVFLLSTRAGGQGITLTAADTVVIYDSDWNPQNDLQAMARCHRIGQSKDVTVYRLVAKDTYEEHLFKSASRKYGLDEAILGFQESKDPEQDSKRIAELLMYGAHQLNQSNEEGEAFQSEDIDKILESRTEKRQIGNRAGNTFSVASFAVDEKKPGAVGRAYWESVLPEAVEEFEQQEALKKQPVTLGPRQRKKVNYQEAEQANDDDAEYDAEAEGEEGRQNPQTTATTRTAPTSAPNSSEGPAQARERKPRGPKPKGPKTWKPTEVFALEARIAAMGHGRIQEIAQLEPEISRRHSKDAIASLETILVNTIRITSYLAKAADYDQALSLALEAAGKLTTCVDPLLDDAALTEWLTSVIVGGRDVHALGTANTGSGSNDAEGSDLKNANKAAESVGTDQVKGSQNDSNTPVKSKQGATPSQPRPASASKPKPPAVSALTVKIVIGKEKGTPLSRTEGLKKLMDKMCVPDSAAKVLRGDEFIKRMAKMADTYRHVMWCNARVKWYINNLAAGAAAKANGGGYKRGIPDMPARNPDLPSWWEFDWDERLLYALPVCGWLPRREVQWIEEMLTHPDLKFHTIVQPPLTTDSKANDGSAEEDKAGPSGEGEDGKESGEKVEERDASGSGAASDEEGKEVKEDVAAVAVGDTVEEGGVHRLSEASWWRLKVALVKRLKMLLEALFDPAFYRQSRVKPTKHRRPTKILQTQHLSSALTTGHLAKLPVETLPTNPTSKPSTAPPTQPLRPATMEVKGMSDPMPEKMTAGTAHSDPEDLDVVDLDDEPVRLKSSDKATEGKTSPLPKPVPAARPLSPSPGHNDSPPEDISPCTSDDDFAAQPPPPSRSLPAAAPQKPSSLPQPSARSAPKPSSSQAPLKPNPTTTTQPLSKPNTSASASSSAPAAGLPGPSRPEISKLKRKPLGLQQSMLKFVKLTPPPGAAAKQPAGQADNKDDAIVLE